jgi:hypothetical protein
MHHACLECFLYWKTVNRGVEALMCLHWVCAVWSYIYPQFVFRPNTFTSSCGEMLPYLYLLSFRDVLDVFEVFQAVQNYFVFNLVS